jgi:hypothetical protein
MARRSSAKAQSRNNQQSKARRVLMFLLGLINPLHDPSLTVAIILTFIEEIGSGHSIPRVAAVLALNWVAVKAIVWLVVNFAFASAFLARKAWWALHNPKLAWRVLDALGTEDIIVGPIRELLSQEALEQGGMMGALPALGNLTGAMPKLPQPQQHYIDQPAYDDRQDLRSAEEINHLREALAAYARLLADWSAFTDEKWRTISDSQLGWKALRGRWSNWDEIYTESYAARTSDPLAAQAAQAAAEATQRRFEHARERGSAASAVACFLRDLDTLRQSLEMLDLPEDVQLNNFASSGILSGSGVRGNMAGRTPLIRRPAQMFVDAE